MLMNINEVEVKQWIFHCAKRNEIWGVGCIRVKITNTFFFFWNNISLLKQIVSETQKWH